MTSHPVPPLRFEPRFEEIAPDEPETAEALMASLREILDTTSRDYGHAVRSVHAKSHGLLRGEFEVLDVLPPELAQGLFAEPGRYPAVLRFSTNPGDILDDAVSVPRGLAVKVAGVTGAFLPGTGGAVQDFVLVNAPAFAAPDAKQFSTSLKLLAKTTDKPEGLKKAVSAALRGAERLVEAVGGESPMLKTLGGHPRTHILGETFYSQTPFLYGSYVAKFSVAPVSPQLTALLGTPIDTKDPNALRSAISEFFATKEALWEFRVQLLTNIGTMPVEDASVPWPEEESPYVAVARIRVGPQPAWTEERARLVDDGMAFSPWNGLAAHRPLGSVNRCRRPAYEMSAGFRSAQNGCPILHPASAADLPI